MNKKEQPGIWDERSKTWIRPSGTVRQGRRPMFKPFAAAPEAPRITAGGFHAENCLCDHCKSLRTDTGRTISRLVSPRAAAPEAPQLSRVKGRTILNAFTPEELRDRIKAQAFPSMEDARRYWENKRGRCQGCNAEIAVEDQFCATCETFLIQSMEENK